MWSRMVCRSGGWFLLITSLLILHHTHGAARRKRETVYVADPAGFPLSKPLSVPSKVGSPAVLIQPDRYEFYTFDESGELIKRLMTLQEIQEIIATGDGDDGHILTIAQSDINKPAVTFNFQPPSHVKVHSVVSNVQNVLKSEIEAQKNSPPKDSIFDTPDVSSSWSQILPAVFGNTGGNIAPDSLISPHVGPETDFIVEDKNDAMAPILGDDVEKVNSAVYLNNEKVDFNSDIPINSFVNPEDLLEGEVLQSKTTNGEASTIKFVSTTARPLTNVVFKNTHPTTVKIEPTEKTTNVNYETKEASNKPVVTQEKITTQFKQPTTTSIKQTTHKPTRQTTSIPVRQTTAIPIRQTTAIPVRQSTATSIRQTALPIRQTTSTPVKEATLVPVKQTTAIPVRQTTAIPLTQSTAIPVRQTSVVVQSTQQSSSTPIKQTTQFVKPSTSYVKHTTKEEIEDSSASTAQIKETFTTYQNIPIEVEKNVVTTIKPTSYVQSYSNTYFSPKPVNNQSSKSTTPKPSQKTTIKLASSPFTQSYSTQYASSTLLNTKQTAIPSKISTISTTVKATTPNIIKQTTALPINYSNRISVTQSTTEKFKPISTNSQLFKEPITENTVHKNTNSFAQTHHEYLQTSSKPAITVIRNITQHPLSTTYNPSTEKIYVDTSTAKVKPSSTDNPKTTQEYKNKIQTQKQPDNITHIKISSSNIPSSPSPFSSPTTSQQSVSQTTKIYENPSTTHRTTPQKIATTPQKIVTTPQKIFTTHKITTVPEFYSEVSSTTQHEKPEIDINQIISQIAQNLGNDEPYDISTHRHSTYIPYTSNNYISRPVITTYRPIIQEASEQITKIISSTDKNSYTTNGANKHKPLVEHEVKTSTENIITNKIPEKTSVTKPAYELSESITNLISQIVRQKPTSVPANNFNDKPTEKTNSYKQSTKYDSLLISSALPLASKESDVTEKISIKETTKANIPVSSYSTENNKISTSVNQVQQTTEKINVKNEVQINTKATSTITKVSTESPKKPTIENYVPSGHYITRISAAGKPSPSTSKFEIYKTSNAPTTTTIKKILTPEISTQKTIEIWTQPAPQKESNENNKPLKIDLLDVPANTDDLNDDKVDSVDDYNEETMYDGSETGVTQDDELMEMLNKYSEMFHTSSEVEPKSDEMSDDEDLTKYENKKVTSYKRTDIPEDEFHLFNTSLAPHTEKIVEVKDSSTESTNKVTVAKINESSESLIPVSSINVLNQSIAEDKTGQEDVPEEDKNIDDLKHTVDHTENTTSSKLGNPNLSVEDVKVENIPSSKIPTQADEKNYTPIISSTDHQVITVSNIKPSTESLVKIENENVADDPPQKSDSKQVITTESHFNSAESSQQTTENIKLSPTKNVNIISSTDHRTVISSTVSVNVPTEGSTPGVQKVKQSEEPTISTKSVNQPTLESSTTSTSTNQFIEHTMVTKGVGQHVMESVTVSKSEAKKPSVEITTAKVDENPSPPNLWTLVSTASPLKDKVNYETNPSTNYHPSHLIGQLHLENDGDGLEKSTNGLNEDVYQFSVLCNELGFRYWNAIVSTGIDPKRSLFVSPFAITSLLAMIFMATRGATSEEMNEILKLDDMVTFNPHIVFKNVTESIEVSKRGGVATSAIIRELYSDRSKGRLLSFYKDRVQKFYSGHVEEVNFGLIGDIIRRRTNLLVKRQTWSKIPEYIKHNNLVMKPPLAVFSANIFQTDCSAASTEGRDGEMYFVVSPTIRQRRLVPVPAVVYRSGFLAGYVTELDATVVAIGKGDQIISTIFVMPGQQGSVPRGDDIIDLEKRLLDTIVKDNIWRKLLKSLKARPGLELQIPRLSHRSMINGSLSLQTLGVKDLFDPSKANLAGLNGQDNDLHVSDMILDNTFTTCGEGYIGDQHHVEVYPGDSSKVQRRLWRTPHRPLYAGDIGESWDDLRDYQRAFHDPLHDMSLLSIPLHLRPRQARLPDPIVEPPRLKYDRPFMYFVRHNPTGLILHMGRYNPRLLP